MTQNENTSDIIDIDPESVVENKVEDVPQPSAKSKRKFGTIGLAALAVLVSAIAGGWFYRDVLSTYLPSDQVHAISARVDAIEETNKRVAQKLDAVVGLTDEIKSQLGAAQAAADDARMQATSLKSESGDVKSKLAAIDKSLGLANAAVDELKGKVTSGVVSAGSPDVSDLTARVDKLEKLLVDLSSRPSANTRPEAVQLSQGLANLSAKIAAGASYLEEIKLIGQMIPAAEGLDVLNANAAKGVLTKQALTDGLKAFAAKTEIAKASAEINDDSWWSRTANLFSGLVTIKSVGDVDWNQISIQSAGLVENDQTSEAVKLLEKNLESMPPALQEWRINAAKRIAVDQAMEKIKSAVAREIAAQG